MKKVNDFFALPMTRLNNELRDAYGEFMCDFPNMVYAVSALNALNNVDALADALAELLECAAENNLEGLQAYDDAYEALISYRGEQ